MARPRRPLWKRPNTSFRHGDRKRPDVGDEPTRLTLYLPNHMLDLAEKLAVREGAPSIQLYCEELLTQALEDERSRLQIDDAEARHGPMEGLRAIADDPEYLAEWNASIANRDGSPPPIDVEVRHPAFLSESTVLEPTPTPTPQPTRSIAADTVLRQAGLDGDEGLGFLPCLRRGEVPPLSTVEDLAAALVALDRELAGSASIDRGLAHALHRLALEAQVLHTDAWPNAFDDWTVDAIRAVQAAVERVLSGSQGSY